MHVISKISQQMQEHFTTIACDYIYQIDYPVNNTHALEKNIMLTFVYENKRYLLKLLLIGISLFEIRSFDLNELMFHDAEDGTPYCISDNGAVEIKCKDIRFISKTSFENIVGLR